MKHLLTFILLLLACSMNSYAQVFIQNTMYPQNRMVYNPAAAGVTPWGGDPDVEGLNLILLGRLQWLGVDGGPSLSTVSLDGKISSISSGLGGYVIADRLGPFSTIGANVSYAFHLPIGNSGLQLNFGVNAGILQKGINGDFVYDLTNGEDPLIPAGAFAQSEIVPNLGAGIFLQGPDGKYFFGISGQDLLEPSLEGLVRNNGDGVDSRVPRSFYAMGGYRFDDLFGNERMSLAPTIFARTDGTFPPQVDASLYWTYDPVTFGINYRFFNDSFGAILGFRLSPRAQIGYAFDYTISNLNNNRDLTSHELVFSYTFPKSSGRSDKDFNVKDRPGQIN